MSEEIELTPIELTPIEQSRADHGKRYYTVEENTYNAMRGLTDQIRDFPKKLTKTSLPPWEDLAPLNDDSGYRGIAIDVWRITEADEAAMGEAIDYGFIVEHTREAYEALLPIEEEGDN